MSTEQTGEIIHIARLLQTFDAERFTKTMAAMYHLYDTEMTIFKELFIKPVAQENTVFFATRPNINCVIYPGGNLIDLSREYVGLRLLT